MILYYALGGGLGHIARSFALLSHAPDSLLSRIRLLVSSHSSGVARPHSPCPMDRVPAWAMADRRLYLAYLDAYMKHHSISSLLLDTFPFGLLGELNYLARGLPRVLIGRYLRWETYSERCGDVDDALWPRVMVMIEQQEEAYLEKAARHGRVISAQWPISLARVDDCAGPHPNAACCIVHSGSKEEMGRLGVTAGRIMAEQGMTGAPEVFTPERGLFPLERHLSRYSDIVTGAGYASCAAAAVLSGRVRYHLHPFPRRFDDQALRLRRLQEGRWGNSSDGGITEVAAILWKEFHE